MLLSSSLALEADARAESPDSSCTVASPRVLAAAVNVERLTGPEELEAIGSECDELARCMLPQAPFGTQAWLSHWWRNFGQDRRLLRDEFYVHAVRDARGSLLALAPLVRTLRPSSGPLRLRSINFFGSDKNITELRGLVCAPEHELTAVRALLQHFERRKHEWDWLVWQGIRQGGAAEALLEAMPDVEWQRTTTDHLLELPSSWQELKATRSRNIKESLRKCYNSLKRDGLTFELRVQSGPLELPHALQRFFELHARRAAAAELPAHADYFAGEPPRRLLLELAKSTQGASRLHAFELWIGGQIAASRLGFVTGDELYLYYSGYDPVFARHSVMTTTVAEAIRWAIEHGLLRVNLSSGTDVSKTRWSPVSLSLREAVWVSPTPRGKAAWRLMRQLTQAPEHGALGKLLAVARRSH